MRGLRRFGNLIGVLEVGNTYCKFLIFATKNAEILTCHELKINKIEGTSSDNPEVDPTEILNCVKECIKVATDNLIILEIHPQDIIAIGITNQRESTVLWNKTSGEPLNVVSSNKQYLQKTIDSILAKTKAKVDRFRSVCGLPLNVCFSAIKIKWLIENNTAVQVAIENNECYFGTLDTWILWNLTGGINGGNHFTDLTNASRTLLLNLQRLEWDKRLCNVFGIPMNILPTIKSCSELFGYIRNIGVLDGVPITSLIGDQNASLLGQNCLNRGQTICQIDENISVLFNTGEEIVESDSGLLTTIAYKLGSEQKPTYALEGFIGEGGCSTINWLKKSIIQSEKPNLIDSPSLNLPYSYSGGLNGGCFNSFNSFSSLHIPENDDLTFVPALNGLCAPEWLFQAKGFLSGFTLNTSSINLLHACKESICYQTRTVLNALSKDLKTWPQLSIMRIGGELSEDVGFLQMLADLCSITIERPHISTSASLGCMISAALAVKNLSIEEFFNICTPPIDFFYPAINPEISETKYMKWLSTIKISLNVIDQCNKQEVNDILETKDSSRYILNSIPGCVFLFTSYVIYVFSQQNF